MDASRVAGDYKESTCMNLPKIEKNIPMPGRKARAGAWDGFMRSLKVGDSFVIPKTQLPFTYHVARKCGCKIASRSVDAKNVRVWRIHGLIGTKRERLNVNGHELVTEIARNQIAHPLDTAN